MVCDIELCQVIDEVFYVCASTNVCTGCQVVVCKHCALQTEGVPVCNSKLVARPRPAGQAYVPSLYTLQYSYMYIIEYGSTLYIRRDVRFSIAHLKLQNEKYYSTRQMQGITRFACQTCLPQMLNAFSGGANAFSRGVLP